MNVYIYALSDPRTNMVRYVGKTVDPVARLYGHILARRSNTHKTAWIGQMKRDGVKPKMDILEVIENSNDQDWQKAEDFWINYLRMIGSDLTNLMSGGMGGRRANEESKRKASEGMKAYYVAHPEARVARALESANRKHDPETIEKMRRAKASISPETRNRISTSAKKRGVPAEQIARLIDAGERGRKTKTERAIARKAALPPRVDRRRLPKVNSPQTKEKLRLAALRQWADPVKRKRIHDAIKAKHATPLA